MSNEAESSGTVFLTTDFSEQLQLADPALNFSEQVNNQKSWDDIDPVDHDSPLSILASYYVQRRFGDDEELLRHFNKDITETMEVVARSSPTALPIVRLVQLFDREGMVMKEMKELQGHYLDLMTKDKNAQFSVEMMRDHSDPRVIFYLRELASYYYNAHIKSGRLAKQKKKVMLERDSINPSHRMYQFHPTADSFEKGTVVFYQECEAIQKKICKEIFDLLDVEHEVSDREFVVPLMIEWKKESPFKKDPIKGIRNIYMDEYQHIEETIVAMTHECHNSFEIQMINRPSIEEDAVYNEDNMSIVRATLIRLHKKVAAITLVEAQTSWTDFEERIENLLKIQQQIQEAQVETLNMDHGLLQQLINYAENDQNKFVPEYPRQEMDYQNRNKDIFVERINRKLEALYEKNKEDDGMGIGTYAEMKQLAFEEEMEQFERNVKTHKQELTDAATLLERLARDIKFLYKSLNVARAKQRVTAKAEQARVAKLEAANAARTAKLAEAKAKKAAAKAAKNGKPRK